MPYGVDQGAQCGMEVVLADGTVLRTGDGGDGGQQGLALLQARAGPTPDQLFMQSNFGIVTKMGYWLMPEPEIYMPLWLKVERDDDLGPLIDTLRRLMLDDTIRMVPQIGNVVGAASVMSKRTDWWDGDGPIPEATLQRMADELGCGRWMMRFALYGRGGRGRPLREDQGRLRGRDPRCGGVGDEARAGGVADARRA